VENDNKTLFPHHRDALLIDSSSHVLRLLRGWQVTIGDVVVPLWISWIGLAVATYLAYQGFKLSRRIRSELKVFGK
jgi:hypothetical protein